MKVICDTDNDCPNWQYCYDNSNLCVNFTKCALYNRAEAATPARDSSQCGPCLKGFEIEESTTGKFEGFCKSTVDIGPNLNPSYSSNLYFIVPIAILILVAIPITIFYIKKCRARSINPLNGKYCVVSNKEVELQQVNKLKPSAPPEGICLYNKGTEEQAECCPPLHNKITAINKSQKASAFQAPNWVSNASFSTNETNNNSGESSSTHNVASRTSYLPAPRNNPVANEQQASIMPEQTVEHEDNTRNMELVRANSSTSDNSSNNANSTPINGDGGNAENRNEREDSANIKAVLINQNITMNLNVTNGSNYS